MLKMALAVSPGSAPEGSGDLKQNKKHLLLPPEVQNGEQNQNTPYRGP